MKSLALIALFALLSVGCASVSAGGADMAPDVATAEHEWLQQLAGVWDVHIEANMGPGTEPFVMETTEHVSSFGDLWILSQSSFEMEGATMDAQMALGYDSVKEHFVGTWISSMHEDLWVYRGSLDHARKKLTLETKGPHHSDPMITARYRDTIEITGPNTKRITSTMEGLDGNWATFMVANYTRRK